MGVHSCTEKGLRPASECVCVRACVCLSGCFPAVETTFCKSLQEPRPVRPVLLVPCCSFIHVGFMAELVSPVLFLLCGFSLPLSGKHVGSQTQCCFLRRNETGRHGAPSLHPFSPSSEARWRRFHGFLLSKGRFKVKVPSAKCVHYLYITTVLSTESSVSLSERAPTDNQCHNRRFLVTGRQMSPLALCGSLVPTVGDASVRAGGPVGGEKRPRRHTKIQFHQDTKRLTLIRLGCMSTVSACHAVTLMPPSNGAKWTTHTHAVKRFFERGH